MCAFGSFKWLQKAIYTHLQITGDIWSQDDFHFIDCTAFTHLAIVCDARLIESVM